VERIFFMATPGHGTDHAHGATSSPYPVGKRPQSTCHYIVIRDINRRSTPASTIQPEPTPNHSRCERHHTSRHNSQVYSPTPNIPSAVLDIPLSYLRLQARHIPRAARDHHSAMCSHSARDSPKVNTFMLQLYDDQVTKWLCMWQESCRGLSPRNRFIGRRVDNASEQVACQPSSKCFC
jgi:hypothetical protein